MDRMVDAVTEYLCRRRSVGLLRLTLDLTRRRLDIFAEIGAAEVVKGVVAPPTPAQKRGGAQSPPSERRYMYCARGGWSSTCGRRKWSAGWARPVDVYSVFKA